MAVCSSESRATDTTISFTGESSLTGSIVQTLAAAAGVLKRKTKHKKNRPLIGKYLVPLEYRDFHL